MMTTDTTAAPTKRAATTEATAPSIAYHSPFTQALSDFGDVQVAHSRLLDEDAPEFAASEACLDAAWKEVCAAADTWTRQQRRR